MSRLPAAYAGVKRRTAATTAKRQADARAAGRSANADLYLTVAEIPRPNGHRAKEFPAWGERKDFQPAVLAYARGVGLETHVEAISIGTVSGWLDITFWAPKRTGGLMLRELKGSSHGGATRTKMRRSQLERMNSLRKAGIDAGIWHPEDWFLGICQQEMNWLAAGGSGFLVPLPPLAGPGVLAAGEQPARAPRKRQAKCGCEVTGTGANAQVRVHTCEQWGRPAGVDAGDVNPWDAAGGAR